MADVSSARVWLASKLRDPVAWTEVIQLVKTVVATVAAWVITREVLSMPQAFLAPWSALMVVHSTVYRTFSEGARQVGATVIGVLLAWAVGNALGLNPVAMALMLLASMLVGYLPRLSVDGTAIASAAVLVLTVGVADQDHLLVMRLLDTAIGICVGLVVNAAVWPPLRDFSAARAIDSVDTEVGVLLRDIASELTDECKEENVRDWVDRTQRIDASIDHAWSLVRQARESARFNPRPSAKQVRNPKEFSQLLNRTEQAVAEIRSLARTLGHSITNVTEWEPEFRERWTTILDRLGDAVIEAQPDEINEMRRELGRLANELSTARLPGLHWPEYGALILNLRNVAAAMDRVAESGSVTPESQPHARVLFRG